MWDVVADRTAKLQLSHKTSRRCEERSDEAIQKQPEGA
jgi:hypothetical protein